MYLDEIGKDEALYFYPHEAHGQGSEETLMDLWARWVDWLDFYLKEEAQEVDK